ncbi:hypothetical protein MX160_13085 [Bacillus cytotoxicus]|uniref:hypothetical protein n=1 Tax=Bacillus cytotoxicus TaxID=580165 RepID=UPI00244B6DAF|nr:hypothetical protein [Bacillus cytotoxicus]MDH2888986.1 hypothetical protein [Bacillus cytotoxicus]
MPGNRKANLAFINSIYNEQKEVRFFHTYNEKISTLYECCRTFNTELREHYEQEDYLIEIFMDFRKIINRFFTSLDFYGTIFEEFLHKIFEYFEGIKRHYPELFELYCIPIAKILQELQKEYGQTNFLHEAVVDKFYDDLTENTCIVTRYRGKSQILKVGEFNVPILKDSEYAKQAKFYDIAIFIGSPEFFNQRFSSLFLAKMTYFVSYDIFNNRITYSKSFNILKKDHTINTLLENVTISNGYKGNQFNIDFGQVQEEGFKKEEVLDRHEKSAEKLDAVHKVEANLVILKNNCYTFLQTGSNVRKIDRDTLRLKKDNTRYIEKGDWLLFRNNTNSDLIIEVANQLLNDECDKCRKWQARWKKRLRKYIEFYGVKKIIKYLRKNGVSTANVQYLRNWLSEESISMKQFDELLIALKFKADEIKNIKIASKKLHSVHIRAGREITKTLLDELDESIVDDVDDNGYATFTSHLVKGASFSIEVVEEVVPKVILVDRYDILRVWRD